MPLPPPSRSGRLLLLVTALSAVLVGRPAAVQSTGTAWSTGTGIVPAIAAAGAAPAAVFPSRSVAMGSEATAFRPPLNGPLTVTRRFEPPLTPYGPGHRGVDFADPPGTRVVAAADGTVSFAGAVGGHGVIAVTHGALRTTYEPVSPMVRIGQVVEAGQPLGVLQQGHQSCPVAACLHWGLLRGAAYLDPLSVLPLIAPRLLPLDAPAR
ncbi:MAG: M23 family metallopeptidase [Frankia sp.]